MKKARIAGVSINLGHESLKFKNFEEMSSKEQLFSHLTGDEKKAAQKELGEALGLTEAAPAKTAK